MSLSQMMLESCSWLPVTTNVTERRMTNVRVTSLSYSDCVPSEKSLTRKRTYHALPSKINVFKWKTPQLAAKHVFDCLLGLREQTRTSCNGFRVTLICGSVFVVYFSIFQPNGLSRTFNCLISQSNDASGDDWHFGRMSSDVTETITKERDRLIFW